MTEIDAANKIKAVLREFEQSNAVNVTEVEIERIDLSTYARVDVRRQIVLHSEPKSLEWL